jgi:predicted RNA-binding protein with PIN domain
MPPLYLVDGFNVLHAAVLVGRERREWWGLSYQARVLGLSESFQGGEVWVIFDARGSDRISGTERVQVRFAPDADDCIVELCAELRGRRLVTVVTADRSLGDRARHRGAARLSPWKFAEQCIAPSPSAQTYTSGVDET